MDRLDVSSGKPDDSPLPRPHRLVRRLAWLYGGAIAVVLVLVAIAALPGNVLPKAHSLTHEALAGGLAGMVLSALLLAFTTLLATMALTAARFRYAATATTISQLAGRRPWSLADPGFAARQLQALIVPIGSVLIWVLTRLLWPRSSVSSDAVGGNVAAAFVLGIAFVSLMAERVVNAFPAPQLREAPMLRRLLLLVTVILAVAACVQFARDAGQGWVHWVELIVLWVPSLVALELTLRALARLFLPPPSPADARAVADSLLVGLITGGPRAPGTLLRTHFGLDFARSWALSFLGSALWPALFGTTLLCWGLSGLKLIDLAHRGVYERFGAPVAVLGPGLHLLLPWPMGRMRLVEYGAIHAVAIGVDAGDQGSPPTNASGSASDEQVNAALAGLAEEQHTSVAELPAAFAAEGLDYGSYVAQLRDQMASGQGTATHFVPAPLVSAEAVPPLSLNRLWESVHADQAHYLVASQGTGEQGFQSVDTEIYVLYRVGLSDRAALQSVYTVTDPEALVREDASRLVLRYFNSRTLEEVLYAQHENVADMLARELAVDINSYHAGIDIVSVLIEEIHPPSGAAEAYHAVQAAKINANASIADERGRAQRTAGVAQQEAHQLLAAATGQAAETRDAANAEAYRFEADERAYQKDGKSFVLERLYSNLVSALKGKPLTIMDHRLSANDGPIIDMRPIAVGQAAEPAAAVPAAPPAPGGPPIEFEPAFSTAD